MELVKILSLFLLVLPLSSFAATTEQWQIRRKTCGGQDNTSPKDISFTMKAEDFAGLPLFYAYASTITVDESDRQCHRIFRYQPEKPLRKWDVPTEYEGSFSLGRVFRICWWKRNGKLEEPPYNDESEIVRDPFFDAKYSQVNANNATFEIQSSVLCNGEKTRLELVR